MVAVVDRNGKHLGEVPQSTTSVGAGKIAGGEVVFSRRWDITKGIGGKGRMTIRRTGNRWQAVVDGRTFASPQYGQKPRRSPDWGFPLFATTVRDAETE